MSIGAEGLTFTVTVVQLGSAKLTLAANADTMIAQAKSANVLLFTESRPLVSGTRKVLRLARPLVNGNLDESPPQTHIVHTGSLSLSTGSLFARSSNDRTSSASTTPTA